MKVVVGISGGVDSAVAAARLVKRGFDVTGVFMDIGLTDYGRAEGVCRTLGIPLMISDARDELENNVVKPFITSYRAGTTPNPCVLCNPVVKYPTLLKAADSIGAEYIATGHYAGTVETDGETFLRQGISGRDQSYMLYRLSPETLKRCLFPIGDTPKDVVRAEAAESGLEIADAPDSMEICFIPDGDYAAFIKEKSGGMPEGDVVDAEGRVTGRHGGLCGYTVGQRRGLGTAGAGRMYVTAVDTVNNRVVIGPEKLLYKEKIELRDVIFRGTPGMELDVKIRHSRVSYRAVFDGKSGVEFTGGPARAPSPGQSAVFYKDGIVLGGGIIC